MFKHKTLLLNAKRLCQAAEVFDIPVISAQQAPEIWGYTVEELTAVHWHGVKVFNKTQFSILEPEVIDFIESTKRTNAVLYGMAAQQCVLCSALDLIDRGYGVTMVTDGLSSLSRKDRKNGIHSMIDAGADFMSFDQLMFDLLKTEDDPHFEQIMRIVRDTKSISGYKINQ